MKKILIDVSEHNGVIDWEKVRYHIDGAILRCGYGSDYKHQDDLQFKRNADECTRLGIPFGVYIYSYGKTIDRVKSEAAHVLRLIKPYKLSYPVYLDLEEPGLEEGAVIRARVFGSIIEEAGYWCGVYANLNWWENHLQGLERFTKWVAQYYKECQYTGSNLDIWQYTAKGSIPGIKGNVDMNECYRDFPAEILGKAAATPATKPVAPAAPAEKEEKPEVDYADSYSLAKAGVYEVQANSGLNLRSGASTNKNILETMPNCSKVKCYGYYTGEWLYVVSASGKKGFCHSDYLEKE